MAELTGIIEFTPDEMERLRRIEEQYGIEEAKRVNDLWREAKRRTQQVPTLPEAGRLPAPPARNVAAARGSFIDQKALELGRTGLYTPAEAKVEAIREADRLSGPRGVQYNPPPAKFIAEARPEEREGSAALGQAFRRQQLESPELAGARREAQQRDDEMRAEARNYVIGVTERTGLSYDQAWEQFLKRTKAATRQEAPTYWQELTGKPSSEATTQELDDTAEAIYQGQLSILDPERARGHEPSLTQAAKEMALGYVQDLLTTVTPAGQLVESWPGMLMRDVLGTMRFVVDPVKRALTYEVDEQGNPRDPSDPAYKLDKYLKEGWEERNPGTAMPPISFTPGKPFMPRVAQPVETTEEESNLSYAQRVGAQIADTEFLGTDLMELKDYQATFEKVGLPNAPFWIGLGAEMWVPATPLGLVRETGALKAAAEASRLATARRAGRMLADELGVPSLKEATKGTAEAEAKVSEELRRSLQLRREAQAAASQGRYRAAGEIAAENAEDIAAARKGAQEASREAAGFRAAKKTRTLLDSAEEQSIRQVTAEMMAREMVAAEMLNRLPPASARAARQFWARGTLAGRLPGMEATAEGFRVQLPTLEQRMLQAWGRSKEPLTKRALDWSRQAVESTINADVQGAAALRRAGAPAPALARIPKTGPQRAAALKAARQQLLGMTDAVKYEAAVRIAKQKIAQALLDEIPGDMIFVTPTVVVSRKAWDRVGPRVENLTQRVMNGKFTRDGWVAATNLPVRAVERILGREKLLQSDYWLGVYRNLKEGKALNGRQYHDLFDLVLGGTTTRAVRGAEDLRWYGKQAKVADVPLERRFQGARDIGDILAGVRNYVRSWTTRWTGAPMFGPVKAETPMGVSRWAQDVNSEIANISRQLVADLKANPGAEGTQQLIAKEWERVVGKSEERKAEEWEKVARIFFDPEARPVRVRADKELNLILREEMPRVGEQLADLTPEALEQYIANLRRRFPNELPKKGLATPILGMRGKDAIFETLLTWVSLARRDAVVVKAAKRLVDMSPELQFPGRFAQDTAMMLRYEQAAGQMRGVSPAKLRTYVDDLNKAFRNAAAARATINQEVAAEILKLANSGVDVTSEAAKALITSRVHTAFDDIAVKGISDADKTVIKAMNDEAKAELIRPIIDFQTMTLTDWGAVRMAPATYVAGVRTIPMEAWFNPAQKWAEGFMRYQPDYFKVRGQALGIVTGDQAKLFTELLEDLSKSEGILGTLRPLRIADRQGAEWAWEMLLNEWRTARRIVTSGTLGGILPPGTRYMSTNLVTGPAIIATTLGGEVALGAVRELSLRPAQRLIRAVRGHGWRGTPEQVLFTSTAGRVWTRAEYDAALARRNIRFSQAGFEFGEGVLPEMMRAAKTDQRIQKSYRWLGPGALRNTLRWFDPTNKNVWNRLAEMNDEVYREAVFMWALKEGRTEAEAAEMARQALLDYGSVTKAEREIFARNMLFYAFRSRMLMESFSALVRNPQGIKNIAELSYRQMREAGVWALSPSQYQTRLWGYYTDEESPSYTANFGPGNPTMESFNLLIGAMSWAIEDRSLESGVTGVQNFMYSPVMKAIVDAIRTHGLTQRDQGLVPAWQVMGVYNTAAWPDFKRTFEITEVQPENMRAGEPSFEGRQFEFTTKAGKDRWILFNLSLATMGAERTARDYVITAARSGYLSDEQKQKLQRYEEGSGVWAAISYLVSLNTPIKVPDELTRTNEALRQIERELREGAKQ